MIRIIPPLHWAGGLLAALALNLIPFATPGAASALVSTGAVWKFLDDGSNQGTSWQLPNFDDSSWLSGCAQLGYGEGDECTVVNGGPNPLQRHITTYFRHPFAITNAAQYVALSLQLLRDDGAVVYLNGIEIFRDNLPPGAVLFNTPASQSSFDGFYVSTVVCGVPLVEGTNLLAVEIHQVSGNSSDISFDLAIEGLTVLTPDLRIVQPAPSARVSAGEDILIAAIVSQPCGHINTVEFFEGVTSIGVSTNAPFQVTWTNISLGDHTLYAIAANEFGTRATSGPVHIRALVPGSLVLVPPHATWRYLDNGSDQGTNWQEISFDDSGWSNGVAELGYGDADEGRPEATQVGYGPDPDNKYITTYFRHTFTVTNSEFLPYLALRVLRDDGVAVYLNGVEVLRNSLPAGSITHTNFATASVGGDAETNWIQTCISPSLLVNGTNLIAAEIHQAFPQSSDISFDLELRTTPPEVPGLNISVSADTVLICWPGWAECYGLETADRVGSTAIWQPVNTAPVPAGEATCVALPLSANAGFYRLRLR